MVWMRVDGGLRDHRKINRLARRLNQPLAVARGMIIALWLRVLVTDPDGDLVDWDPEDIFDACGAEGLPLKVEDVVQALVSCGLLDQSEEGFRIHDWDEYTTSFREAGKRRERRVKSGTCAQNVRGQVADKSRTSRGQGQVKDLFGRGVSAGRDETDETDRTDDTKKPPKPVASDADVQAVIDFYRTRLNHPRARGTAAAKNMIRARLREGFSVKDLCVALEEQHANEFYVAKGYLSLEHALRNHPRVTQFLEARDRRTGARPSPPPPQPRRTQHNAHVAMAWASKDRHNED